MFDVIGSIVVSIGVVLMSGIDANFACALFGLAMIIAVGIAEKIKGR